MTVTYFFRKKTSNISIERYFSDVIGNLPSTISTKTKVVPFLGGRNLLSVFVNTIWAKFHEDEINHITGDIHYLSILLSKRKTILTIHDCYPLRNNRGIKYAIIKKFWYSIPCKRVDIITVVSEATKKELLDYINIDPSKIKVIPVCISNDFNKKSMTFNTDLPQILHVGTRENKNLENHVKALEGLHCHLRIIGGLSENQKILLNRYSINYSNVENISDSQLVQEFKRSDILLFASTYEGFGMPIVEAQAVGLPVVTSNFSPMTDVADNGALFVNPEDSASIRKSLLSIIESEKIRNNLINNGFENANKFTPEVIVDEYIKIYKQL